MFNSYDEVVDKKIKTAGSGELGYKKSDVDDFLDICGEEMEYQSALHNHQKPITRHTGIRSEGVRNKQFEKALFGYDINEIHQLLQEIADTLKFYEENPPEKQIGETDTVESPENPMTQDFKPMSEESVPSQENSVPVKAVVPESTGVSAEKGKSNSIDNPVLEQAESVPDQMLSAPANNETNSRFTNCPECEGRISKKATFCPHCGFPLVQEEVKPQIQKSEDEYVLSVGSPTTSNFAAFLQALGVLSIIAGIILAITGARVPKVTSWGTTHYEFSFVSFLTILLPFIIDGIALMGMGTVAQNVQSTYSIVYGIRLSKKDREKLSNTSNSSFSLNKLSTGSGEWRCRVCKRMNNSWEETCIYCGEPKR